MNSIKFTILLIIVFTGSVLADGLMIPAHEDYPKDFLFSRLTKVDVHIDGVIARVSAYQEFVNEWHQDADAVYSFPLPIDARATQFLYWYEDTIYTAVLEVKEQAPNPGTGEGGIIAEVNKYIGPNGIKIALKNIPAGKIQKVQLDYIQLVDYYKGDCTFKYPLETGEFITYPLEHLEFNINIKSKTKISGYEILNFENTKIIESTEDNLSLNVNAPKAYLNNDFEITYHTEINQFEVDFYSVNNDTMPGHFGLILHPPNQVPLDSLLNRRLIFLISNSSLMFGYKLNQSLTAVEQALDELSENDEFNICVFNYSMQSWQSTPVAATADNIQMAKDYLKGISAASGSNMQFALEQCMNQIADSEKNNAIVIFTDGFSFIDPIEIADQNEYKTGIFPIAIGDDFDIARLEMLAAYNFGFVTYIDLDDNLNLKISRLMGQVTQPILKDVAMEYGKGDLSDILPEKIPSTYAGTYFFICGRYENPGISALSIAGTSNKGEKAYDFLLDFQSETNINKFVESLWAKQMIEYLEWQIEIYGETEELKSRLIEISLAYNIRCRYTAYIADYETLFPTIVIPENNRGIYPAKSHLLYNYPNPFNPMTTIVVYISPQSRKSAPWLIRIYNTLGQLVYIIDLSSYGPGYHQIKFNGLDRRGNPLPSGVYFALLQIGDDHSMMRMTLIK